MSLRAAPAGAARAVWAAWRPGRRPSRVPPHPLRLQRSGGRRERTVPGRAVLSRTGRSAHPEHRLGGGTGRGHGYVVAATGDPDKDEKPGGRPGDGSSRRPQLRSHPAGPSGPRRVRGPADRASGRLPGRGDRPLRRWRFRSAGSPPGPPVRRRHRSGRLSLRPHTLVFPASTLLHGPGDLAAVPSAYGDLSVSPRATAADQPCRGRRRHPADQQQHETS